MFKEYRKLIGNDAKQEKPESLISKCFNSLIKPYRKLFRSSDKQPQEIIQKQASKKLDKPDEAINAVKPPGVKRKLRYGKVLWRKK